MNTAAIVGYGGGIVFETHRTGPNRVKVVFDNAVDPVVYLVVAANCRTRRQFFSQKIVKRRFGRQLSSDLHPFSQDGPVMALGIRDKSMLDSRLERWICGAQPYRAAGTSVMQAIGNRQPQPDTLVESGPPTG